MTGLDLRQVRRRYLILLGLRWLPTGLLIPVMVLLPLQRGLTPSQLGIAAAIQGLVILGLELPTGGLSDSLGRRPILLAAGLLALASLGVIWVAHSPALFVAGFALQGVYRALDSGPLEAWFVDAALAADPGADLASGLARGGTVLGLAVAAGALLSGGLVTLSPFPSTEALAVPVLAAMAAQGAGVAAMATLLTEEDAAQDWPAVLASVRAVPSVIRDTLGLWWQSGVLRALVTVELFWGFGMVAFEMLMPLRLAEVSGGAGAAAAFLGPATSAAWAVSAAGAALVPRVARRLGAAATAGGLRLLQGITVAAMALSAGPAGVVAGYLATYVVHGASNPLHMALLHRQVTRSHRTTVASLNSMVGQPAGSAGLVALTALAQAASVTLAMLAGAAVLALAAPLYLPARRAERRGPPPPSGPAEAPAIREPGTGAGSGG